MFFSQIFRLHTQIYIIVLKLPNVRLKYKYDFFLIVGVIVSCI